MKNIYIASDDEKVGKTSLCVTLAWKLKQRGKKVSAFKPVFEAGCESDADEETFNKLLGQPTFTLPMIRMDDGLTPETMGYIKSSLDKLSDGADITLVEGSWRLTPTGNAQIIELLNAKALIVVPYRPELSPKHLKHWVDILGDRLAGFVINGLTKYQNVKAREILVPSMQAEGLNILGVIPEDRRLLSTSVRMLATHLEGRFITGEEHADVLVENVMVGGWTLDPGELYFGLKESKAVIVRGDRPDMQLSALSTPTSCIICTGGKDPIEYVIYEAEQEKVPIFVVESDTLSVMASLNEIMEKPSFNHEMKLRRYSELLDKHINLAALYHHLGL